MTQDLSLRDFLEFLRTKIVFTGTSSHDDMTSKKPVCGVKQPLTGNTTQADIRVPEESILCTRCGGSQQRVAGAQLVAAQQRVAVGRAHAVAVIKRAVHRSRQRPPRRLVGLRLQHLRPGQQLSTGAQAQESRRHTQPPQVLPARPAARRAARVMTRCRNACAACRGPARPCHCWQLPDLGALAQQGNGQSRAQLGQKRPRPASGSTCRTRATFAGCASSTATALHARLGARRGPPGAPAAPLLPAAPPIAAA
jgi:hypothetical protein